MKIRFSSAFFNLTKEREVELELDDVPIKEVLNTLVERYGDEFKTRLLEGDQVRRFVNIFVNGEDIRHLNGLDTYVKKDDEISILPAVSGGSL
jgi:molybdopterin synthase sulfur carrier subunit